MSEKIVKNWVALADYDLKTAEAMFQGGRYIYVAFTCQQAIEKMFKALYVKEKKQTPPYIHNLLKLAEKMPFYNEFTEIQLQDLGTLNSYYLQSRYSDQMQEIMTQFTKDQAANLFEKTKIIYLWLKSKL
jgi:HEPN domain-containing protein